MATIYRCDGICGLESRDQSDLRMEAGGMYCPECAQVAKLWTAYFTNEMAEAVTVAEQVVADRLRNEKPDFFHKHIHGLTNGKLTGLELGLAMIPVPDA